MPESPAASLVREYRAKASQWLAEHAPVQDDHYYHFEEYDRRAREFLHERSKYEHFAVSGVGSEIRSCEPFIEFFPVWLRDSKATSMLEVSCGHWASGWQQAVQWPAIKYHGVDIASRCVVDNLAFVNNGSGVGRFGLSHMNFTHGDMMAGPLPAADVLFTKDTLIHLPNAGIMTFLMHSVVVCPPRYRYVLFVHDYVPGMNEDIRLAGFHHLDLAAPPFNLTVEQVFHWSPPSANLAKVAQLYKTPMC
eukprot:gnl/TRDRNA2_/TRDRNA2_82725_c1_seq1.p1 gnl/TRDRNA2_/TRDRNA2_82725_c1~~gnl/TRDRNA2_/TRDRNA2_82725_c1_seq1.p1  ORF type:complete len:278 (+),score=38.36 gnl/TRDRNA2_/TRDRNA2_82725_c1_seq1:89-835(+)